MTPKSPGSAARHDDRARELLAQEAAKWIQQEAGLQSLITVTKVALTARGTRATIYVSIFPEEQMRPALAFLERSRRDLGLHLREYSRIRPIPMIEFLPDDGSRNTAPVDELPKKP